MILETCLSSFFHSMLLFNLLFLLHLIQHRSFPVYVRFDVWHETRSSYDVDN